MYRNSISSRARNVASLIFAACAAAAATSVRADNQVFIDHFNNGSVADSDTQTGFWNTLISGAGAPTEGSGAGGSLLLNVTGANGGNPYPFTELASPLQSSFNFFHAPIVIQASGLNYGPNTNPTSLTQFTLTTQALSNAGPNTEYPAQDCISLWVANPNNDNGQILLGLKQDSPNASSAFDRFQALGPIGRDSFGPVTFNGGQVHAFKLVIGPTFYYLTVTHDSSGTDTTPSISNYAGGLDINRGAGPGWGTIANPAGDNALNIESQLNNVTDPTAVNPFNVGQVTVSQFVTDYIGTDGGNWSDSNNWDDADVQHPNGDNSSSNVPNFTGANVNFGPTAAPTTVVTDHDETLGVLTLNSAQLYTITVSGNGEGTIHLATRYLNSEVNVLQGNHTIFSPLELHNDAVFTVNGNSTLTAPTILAFAPATTNFTKAGAGKLVTSSIAMQNLNLNGGTLALDTGTNAMSTSDVQTLNIATTNTSWIATLDMTSNAMVIDYPSGTASPLGVVANQIKSGRGTGAWNGTGITSSAAAAVAAAAGNIHKTALGFAEASALGITSFGGQTFDDSAVLIRYTFTGDSNLDGTVNTNDFTALASHFNQSGSSWLQGDFNYDGKVNALDFNALATNFGQAFSAPALGSLVPEPVLASVCLGLALSLRRTRRRSMRGHN